MSRRPSRPPALSDRYPGLTATAASRIHTGHRGAEYTVDLIPKFALEVLANDADAGRCRCDHQSAGTGTIGDGRV